MNHWICAPEFLPLKPIDHFCRELEQGSEPETNLRNKHILFRKTFQVKDVNRSYRLRITADDYYKLWINGQYVGRARRTLMPCTINTMNMTLQICCIPETM